MVDAATAPTITSNRLRMTTPIVKERDTSLSLSIFSDEAALSRSTFVRKAHSSESRPASTSIGRHGTSLPATSGPARAVPFPCALPVEPAPPWA